MKAFIFLQTIELYKVLFIFCFLFSFGLVLLAAPIFSNLGFTQQLYMGLIEERTATLLPLK